MAHQGQRRRVAPASTAIATPLSRAIGSTSPDRYAAVAALSRDRWTTSSAT
jgi:hypothetical protein